MAHRFSLRISPRLYMMLCVGASLLLAWAGLRYKLYREETICETQMNSRSWQRPFSVFVRDDNGRVYRRIVDSLDDLTELRSAQRSGLTTVTSLTFSSSEAWAAFDRREFPQLNTLKLDDHIQDFRATMLNEIVDLRDLRISMEKDFDVLAELTILSRLEHFHMDLTGDRLSFADFPTLPNLKTLTIHCRNRHSPGKTEMEQLHERMPQCKIYEY